MARKLTGFLLLIVLFVSSGLAHGFTLLEEIEQGARESESSSLLIVQNGEALSRHFYAGHDRLQNVQSITKSVVALLVAILLDEGRISSLDTPMTEWIPAWSQDAQKSKITLRMILNHTSGLPDTHVHENFWGTPDIVTRAAATPLARPPGSGYEYSSLASSLLQAVIAKASGTTVSEYVKAKLWDPLEIRDFHWSRDEIGQEQTSGGISLKTEGLLKLGKLMLDDGYSEGRQIVSRQSRNLLVSTSQNFYHYGLLWWLRQAPQSKGAGDLFFANGWGGQFLVVYPQKRLIAIRTKMPGEISDLKKQSFWRFQELIANWE